MRYVSIKYALSTNLCRFDVKRCLLKKILLLQLFFFFFNGVYAQAPARLQYISADSNGVAVSLQDRTAIFVDSTSRMSTSDVAAAAFRPLQQWQNNAVKPSMTGRIFYLKFTVNNPSNLPKIFYFYPGKLFDRIGLYQRNGAAFVKVETSRWHNGFVPIKIGAGKMEEYIVRLKFFKTGFNRLDPQLISSNHIDIYKNDLFASLDSKKIAGILLSGMLLMMIFVTLILFFISRRIEFLYNSLYTLSMFLLIFLTTYLSMNPSWFKGFFISYLDLLLLIVGMNCYLAFTRNFLDTKQLYPRLDRLLRIGSLVISAIMVLYSCVFFLTESYRYAVLLENLMKILLLVISIIFICLAFVQKNRLINYLAIGVGTQLLFSGVSLALAMNKSGAAHIYNSPIFYFELGIIASLIFFLLGLFYKNKLELITKIKEQEAMKLEVEKQSFENKLTIYKTQQEERNRISADMHDDLGAGMTTIRLYSELAKTRLGDTVIPELNKISSSANELIDNMNAIIWSMNNDNDSLNNMVGYIRRYTMEYLENTQIVPSISIPDNLPDLIINGTIRRNIFLVIKEALQNIVKHSKATKVSITMHKEPEGFSLEIHDNGKGIDFNNLRPHSNGLSNMRKRMEAIQVDFKIENNGGTCIRMYAKTR